MSEPSLSELEQAARAVRDATGELRRLRDKYGHHENELRHLTPLIEFARSALERAEQQLREAALRCPIHPGDQWRSS